MEPQRPPDRRASLAFAVFLLVVAGYLQLRACRNPPVEVPPPPVDAVVGETPSSGAPPAETPPPPADSPYPATRDVMRDDEIVVDTNLYRARFTNAGAGLVELSLKKFFRTAELREDPSRHDDPSAWLPMVVPLAPDAPAFRLRRNATGAPLPGELPLDRTIWEHARAPLPDGEELTFRLQDGTGRTLEKVVRLRNDRYDFEVELRFANERTGPSQGTESLFFLGAPGIYDERTSPFQSPPGAVISESDSDTMRVLEAGQLEDGPQSVTLLQREELLPFFGVRNNFFAFALAPDADTSRLIDQVNCARVFDPFAFERAVHEKQAGGERLEQAELAELRRDAFTNVTAEAALRVAFPQPGSPPTSMRFTVFAGAKSPEFMQPESLAPFRVLYEVEYGSWTSLRWINRVLLWWMRLMEAMTGNWGVAIILLTFTVKVLLFPLNRMQSRSMEQFQKKMKVLQPQLEELKRKHKGNLQKLNVEQQKIMREHGVRPPVFGCLVVFLQAPVWFGLFQITKSAPELRQSGFFGWINDLSAPDVVPLPFTLPWIGGLHLLPIVMLVAWLLQNRMMPKATDPQQAQMQKMMNFFPFVFLVMLYKYASGQSLYMLTNSVLGMVQMKLLKVTPAN